RVVVPSPPAPEFGAAARARGVPVQRLGDGRSAIGTVLQLGHGVHQRRLLAAKTDRTGYIAETIAEDKELTRAMLRAVGVPVPEGRPVADAEEAWAAALELGLPVVVKPRDSDYGRGVALHLTT